MFFNANQIYSLLCNQAITHSIGNIQFHFLDISVDIQEKSAIGDLFQEWFAKWLTTNNIQYIAILNDCRENRAIILRKTHELRRVNRK